MVAEIDVQLTGMRIHSMVREQQPVYDRLESVRAELKMIASWMKCWVGRGTLYE